MDTKRINLSFSLDREDAAKVYDIISSQNFKTDFVIRAVIYYIEKGTSQVIDKEIIKDAVREVLESYGPVNIGQDTKKEVNSEIIELPMEVFDMFNSL
ncbi:hypothetical protein [Candidatus Clostridium radicumherbarum]|uniref:CopG family transcriptional regulator n=1 Tax=Candidatus Clostridium radicumherbarum TaxID=3381662 RepID=A0ABW8TWN1_9CLOT